MTADAAEKTADPTFVELFALISTARITITETCSILGVSREAWRGWRAREWGMSDETRARAAEMIHGVRFYVDQGVLPAHAPDVHSKAIAKVRERVERKCPPVAPDQSSKDQTTRGAL